MAYRHQYTSRSRVFLDRGEAQVLNRETQLPQFHPRTYWPVQAERRTTEDAYNNVALNALLADMDWNNQARLSALRGSMQQHHSVHTFRQLVRMNPFRQTGSYHGRAWWLHVAVCQKILKGDMLGNALTEMEMTTFMEIMSYGMDKSLIVLDPWRVNMEKVQNSLVPEQEHDAAFDKEMAQGDLNLGNRSCNDIGRQLHRRRWIVAPIFYPPEFWAMTIFDRRTGQLYIFDSGRTTRRHERIVAATNLWVKFWNFMHKPFSFQYFVPQVTPGPNVKVSGLLAVIWAMANLRNRVGEYMRVDDEHKRVDDKATRVSGRVPRHINVSELDTQFSLSSSSLPLHDWVPEGCRSAASGLEAARRILRCVLLNEMGLMIEDLVQVLPLPGFVTSRSLLQPLIEGLTTHYNQMRQRRKWTGLGGAQLVICAQNPLLEYDENAERFFKRWYNQHDDFVTLIDRPEQIVFTPHHDVQWGKVVQFNPPDSPLVRLMPPRVTKLRRRRAADTRNSRHFSARLLNRCLPSHGSNLHAPLRLDIRNIRYHQHANHERTARCELGLFFLNHRRTELTIDLPLPDEFDVHPESDDSFSGDDSSQNDGDPDSDQDYVNQDLDQDEDIDIPDEIVEDSTQDDSDDSLNQGNDGHNSSQNHENRLDHSNEGHSSDQGNRGDASGSAPAQDHPHGSQRSGPTDTSSSDEFPKRIYIKKKGRNLQY